MIFNALWSIVSGGLNAMVALLPSWSPPSNSNSSFTMIGQAISTINDWVNVSLFLTVAGVVLTAAAVAVTVRIVVWCYHQIPFNG